MNTLSITYGDKRLLFRPLGEVILVSCLDSSDKVLWHGKIIGYGLWDGKGWDLEKLLKKLKQWEREESANR